MIKFILLFFALYTYIIYLFGGLFMIIPVLILNLFNDNIGFGIKNLFASSVALGLKYLIGTEIFVNSNVLADEIVDNSSKIVIQNHFTEIDHLVISFFMTNIKNIMNFKLISLVKKSIGFFYLGIGLFSAFSNDIYLNRNINTDYQKLKSCSKCNILYMFPEGTRFNKKSKENASLWIKNNNKIKLNYHLYPRITGLKTIISKSNNKFKFIYDLTVYYNTIERNTSNIYNMYDFFYKCNFPTRIYININKYHINIKKINKELEQIYVNKDIFIANFNPNQNKFTKLKFNYINALLGLSLSFGIGIFSIYIFFKYEFIRTFYFIEIITYLFYFYVIY